MWNTSKFNAPISWENSFESSIPQNIKHFRFLNDTLRKRNFRNLRISSYDFGDPDTWIIMERTSSDEIFSAVVLANRWMERSLGISWSFIKNFALRHKHVLPLFPIASTINPEVARSGLFSEANSLKKPGVQLISNVFTSGNQISHRFNTSKLAKFFVGFLREAWIKRRSRLIQR